MVDAHIAVLFRRYFPAIRAKCARMLGDGADAEDVAQETFVRLWRADLAQDDERATLAWIYRTASRAAIDRIRERHRRRGLHEAGGRREPEREGSAESILGARAWLDRIARDAPEDELEVAMMSRLDRMTQPEIAQVIGSSERTVRRMLDRFDRRLARLVGDERLAHDRSHAERLP